MSLKNNIKGSYSVNQKQQQHINNDNITKKNTNIPEIKVKELQYEKIFSKN